LKRLRTAVLAQHQGFAVQHQICGRGGRSDLDQLRDAIGHGVSLPAEDPHLAALLMDLHACPIQLELE
jgi:hypothetical protein